MLHFLYYEVFAFVEDKKELPVLKFLSCHCEMNLVSYDSLLRVVTMTHLYGYEYVLKPLVITFHTHIRIEVTEFLDF